MQAPLGLSLVQVTPVTYPRTHLFTGFPCEACRVQEECCACSLWLDNVYMRMLFRNLPDERAWLYPTLAGQAPLRGPLFGLGAHYITRTTFQGDGLGPTVGVWADEAVYIESAPPLHPHSVM